MDAERELEQAALDGKLVPVLDHGYVRLVESWGSDERIIEAARMSTGKGFQGWGPAGCPECCFNKESVVPPKDCKLCKGTFEVPGDEKLLRFLYENKHTSPFEMGGAIFEVKAPIFVFREWHRHRTQSYNEMSSRYVPLPDENYVPSVERILRDGGSNKQAIGSRPLAENEAETFQRDLAKAYEESEIQYQHALHVGVPKELARLIVPVGRYSKMRASALLKNWLDFLTLRDDEKAQWEIQQYAKAVDSFIEMLFPRTHELYVERRELWAEFLQWKKARQT